MIFVVKTDKTGYDLLTDNILHMLTWKKVRKMYLSANPLFTDVLKQGWNFNQLHQLVALWPGLTQLLLRNSITMLALGPVSLAVTTFLQ